MGALDLRTGPDLPPKTDYGIGCIGAGFIMKDIHLVAYGEAGFNVVAIASRTPANAQAAADERGVETVYDTWQELLDDERVEILDIAYPPDQQLGIIREAVKRPHIKGILAQKPVAFTLDEAVEIVRLCDEAGIKLGVNHNMRYDQSMRALRSLLDAGALGEPIVAEIVMNARPHWQAFLQGYGRIALLNMSIHHLDAFRFQFGDPERIFVSVRNDPSQDFPHKDGSAFYILEYANGLRAIGLDNCYTWADHNIQWRVEGTEGIAKGTIGWPDYPAGSPSTITWTTRAMEGSWERPDLGRPVVPPGVQGHDGPAHARDPGGRGAGDLGADDDRHDGAGRGCVPLGRRGQGGAAERDRVRGRSVSGGPFSLDGRVAIVTGAGGGLGEGICASLAAAGAAVACVDLDAEAAEARAAGVRAAGGSALAVSADVSDAASVTAMVERVAAELGRVDVLVNNAAIYPRRAWTEITEQEWDSVLAVNLKGYFLCARAVFEHLRTSGHGRIVNVASITAFIGMTHLLDYVSSKGAVISFTRALAREIGGDGVTVNAISPGAFPTDAEKIHPNPAEYNQWILDQQSLKRRGAPDDIGNLVVFLASDASSFLTGQVVEIDGGWFMH